MKIAVIGAGYVGLIAAVVFANKGHKVDCIDLNIEKINSLSKNKLEVYEIGLEEKLTSAIQTNHLTFSPSYEHINQAEAIFIAVGTPQADNGSADLSYLYAAIEQIKTRINNNAIIVVKSTVPPGTCNKLQQYLQKQNLSNPVVMNPEFLREGCAINDFLNPERIVIGTFSQQAKELMFKIYASWPNTAKIATDPTTAEMIKYASNVFLATKIAFINEMCDICEKVGADVEMLSLGIGSDKRIGKDFLKTGPGFGGSCFPKDINALIKVVNEQGLDNKILPAVLSSNIERQFHMLRKITSIVGGNLAGKNIGVLGLTFKANTDDVRYSPAMDIISLMLDKGANLKAFDPHGMENAKAILPQITYAKHAEDVAQSSHAIIILTEWSQFIDINWPLIYAQMSQPVVIDLRNLLPQGYLQKLGFLYHRLGKSFC